MARRRSRLVIELALVAASARARRLRPRMATVTALAILLSVLVAPPASARPRLVTLIGVSGSLTSTSHYEAQVSPDATETPKDACLVRDGTVTYEFRMVGKKPVYEVDFDGPLAKATGASFRKLPREPQAKTRVTATSNGLARSTPGDLPTNVACSVESLGFVNDDDVVSLTGISPSLCDRKTVDYEIAPLGERMMLDPVRPKQAAALLRCGWIVASGGAPVLMVGAKSNIAEPRVFFEDGEVGTSVAVTYRYQYTSDNEGCSLQSSFGGMLEVKACTLRQNGTITMRFRLGS